MKRFERPPNHLCPIRSEIATQIAFEPVELEDVQWTMKIRPLLRTEHHIDRVLYEYDLWHHHRRAAQLAKFTAEHDLASASA
jgi:hypothetical protein